MNSAHNETYADAQPILVAVDNIIFGFDVVEEQLKILLFKRLVEPEAGLWSLVGSFVQPSETAEQASKRILEKFTGLREVYLQQLHTYTDLDRDPGARVISIAYYSLIQIESHNKDVVARHNAAWYGLDEIPYLVVDHLQMLKDALDKIKLNALHQPIGFNLLPKRFTLPQLYKLYQEIMRESIDDRNFRKKILSTGLLIRLTDKDKSSSKKGAYYYQFDEVKYNILLREGLDIRFH